MCFSKIYIIIMKYDFKSKAYFSDVFGNLVLAVVGDLGFDVARLSWFPLLIFFCLLLVI